MEVITRPVPLDYAAAGLPQPATATRLELYLPALKETLLNAEKGVPVVLVLPGGGYGFTSPREAEPIALQFAAAGMAAAVLHYAVAPDRFPTALVETAATLRYLRRESGLYELPFSKAVVCGFSAGGHLAASISTLWNTPLLARALGGAAGDFRPDGSILAYPVITGQPQLGHAGSVKNLYGPENAEARAADFSLEEQAGPQNPPAFIWHTCTDDAVPVENSLMYAAALRRGGVPFELHVWPEGGHGLSLANEQVGVAAADVWPGLAGWAGAAITWVRRLG